VRAIATSGIKPLIEQAVDAYRFLASAAHFGKIAIELGA
jgi:hypothetical protein